MNEQLPIFDFGDHYPGSIEIGAKKLPILVKNLTVDELDAFRQDWARFVVRRGEAPMTTQDKAEFEKRQTEFFERTIRNYVTLEKGVARYRGEDVTTGDGLIRMFHARQDVLSPLISEVLLQNSLTEVTRKKSNSSSDSGGGLTPSAQTNGERPTGPAPAPIADSAAASTSAGSAAATDEPSARPSGSDSESDRVH